MTTYAQRLAAFAEQLQLDSFTEAALRDPQALALAVRIGYRVEPWPGFPRTFPGGLRLTLRDGRTLEWREPINRGHPDNPITVTDVQAKFRDNAKRALPAERIAAIIAAVEHLEELLSVADLMALCVTGQQQTAQEPRGYEPGRW